MGSQTSLQHRRISALADVIRSTGQYRVSCTNQGGKLILVESREEQRENHRDTAFHDIAKHLDKTMPDYTLEFYRDVSQKLVQKQEPMLTLEQQNPELALDR
jgi:hypothetical protein